MAVFPATTFTQSTISATPIIPLGIASIKMELPQGEIQGKGTRWYWGGFVIDMVALAIDFAGREYANYQNKTLNKQGIVSQFLN